MKLYQVKSDQCILQVYSINPSHSETAILFLHGGPGSGAKAMMQLPAFQALNQNYHCLYFDQRGSGNSSYELRKGLTIADITHDVFKVIEDAKNRWNIKRLFLWGGSFGGLLASLCMQRFASELDGVILSSPAMTFHREQALDFYNHMKNQYIARFNSQSTDDSELPEIYFSLPDVQDFIYSDMNSSNSLRHICAMSSWFYQYTFEGLFDNISIPLLVMQGKNDPICQYQNIDNEIKQSHLKNIEYHLFENCGHEVFSNQKESFVNIIEAFIRRKS